MVLLRYKSLGLLCHSYYVFFCQFDNVVVPFLISFCYPLIYVSHIIGISILRLHSLSIDWRFSPIFFVVLSSLSFPTTCCRVLYMVLLFYIYNIYAIHSASKYLLIDYVLYYWPYIGLLILMVRVFVVSLNAVF